ncbi:hypothetical protein M0R45_005219 [Rubus argutus]|uniref:Uncharacterized protein n=1 Tax=Rubus argutus TaxID=59490 RepID=A0AAW1YMI6_RUBAR
MARPTQPKHSSLRGLKLVPSAKLAVIYVPVERFLLRKAFFNGPCKNSAITFEIAGTPRCPFGLSGHRKCRIGSLGKEQEEDGVQNLTVKTVTFTGTQNGLRIN